MSYTVSVNIIIFYRFLRSIAYREFSQLVYGILGKLRIPLPCAYHAIRKKFQSSGEEFTGFDEDLSDE